MSTGVVLGSREHADRVRACWLGKSIGSTLGDACEGRPYTHNLRYYSPMPDIRTAVQAAGDKEIVFHYNGAPVMYPRIRKRVGVSLQDRHGELPCRAILDGPSTWHIERVGENKFDLLAESVPDRNELGVRLETGGRTREAAFAMLGPGEAKGYPSHTLVERCPNPECRARKGTCQCGRTARKRTARK